MSENTIEELKALQDDAMHEMSRELEHLDDMRAQVESRMKVMGANEHSVRRDRKPEAQAGRSERGSRCVASTTPGGEGKQADHRDSQDPASPEI